MSTPYRSYPPPYTGMPTQAAAAPENMDLEKGIPEFGVESVDEQRATETSNISICGLFNIATTRGPGEDSSALTASASGLLILFILWCILRDLEVMKESLEAA
ncbi:uncharacterized protein FTOL_01827 [Fusarium torulosum]|uniref:Uncharacterized protein n=1 Tax=Fusarium torulosum TaxID=33205 RepID=A0AAE8M0W7_9HYPO|nr:uncharacterized protein FTOL_01827 [Fusarium torulosum]